MKSQHYLLHSSFVGYLPPHRPLRVPSSNNPAVHWFLISAALGLLSSHFVPCPLAFWDAMNNVIRLIVQRIPVLSVILLPHWPLRVSSYNPAFDVSCSWIVLLGLLFFYLRGPRDVQSRCVLGSLFLVQVSFWLSSAIGAGRENIITRLFHCFILWLLITLSTYQRFLSNFVASSS